MTAKKAKSWRDVLPVHPAAELFPPMSPEELRALGEDIEKHGLQQSITLYYAEAADRSRQYWLLDGRNRLAALEAVGRAPRLTFYPERGRWILTLAGVEEDDLPQPRAVDGDPYAYVISANLHRRHLTAEQRRELIAKVLKAQPEKSDRAIAKVAKVDHKTVGAVRDGLAGRGEIPHVETRTDTKGRKQPARKKRRDVDDFLADKRAREAKATKEMSPAVAPKYKFKPRDNDDFRSVEHFLSSVRKWTGRRAGTQAEINAALEQLRNDGAPGHWLAVAPRDETKLVVDFDVVWWLLLIAPDPPAIAHTAVVGDLLLTAHRAGCPVWCSERLLARTHSQSPGMAMPRESPELVMGWRARNGELQREVVRLERENSALRSEIEELNKRLPASDDDLEIPEILRRTATPAE